MGFRTHFELHILKRICPVEMIIFCLNNVLGIFSQSPTLASALSPSVCGTTLLPDVA